MTSLETISKQKISNQTIFKGFTEDKLLKQDSRFSSKIPSALVMPQTRGLFDSNYSSKK